MERRKAHILGAGVTGLVAGWKLAERGWDVSIYEREAVIGGMARSWRWDGFILDVGPHIYHSPDPEMVALWQREFGDLFVTGDFFCANVKGARYNEYYHYPLSYEALSREFAPELRTRIVDELARTSEAERRSAKNFKEYVRGLVGPTLQDLFFEHYPRKVWGLSTEEMTANWAPKRIEIRQKITDFYHGQWNAVGKFGTGCVLESVRDRLLALGGRIELNRGVKKVETSEHRITSLGFDSGSAFPVGQKDVVISTLPINVMCRLLGGRSELAFRGIVSVYVAVDRPSILPAGYCWLYYDAPEIIFNRVTESKTMAPEVAPADRSFVVAEIAYSRGDDLDRQNDGAIIARVVDDLRRVGLLRPGETVKTSINRQPNVYPILTKDYQHELARAREVIGRYDQLHSIGTTGEFNYADIQILFRKALDLVDLLTDAKANLVAAIRRPRVDRLAREVVIAGRKVGTEHRPFIIAEAGINHNGSVDLGLKLVDEAAAAGCDAIKFQTYRAADRVSSRVMGAHYAEQITGLEENLFQTLSRLELDPDAHRLLFARAKERGITIFSTPFGVGDVGLLESLEVACYKIASFDIGNLPLLRAVAATGKPMIVSTGMSTLGMIEEALEAIRAEGNGQVILLHCVSAYPAAPEDMNLATISTLAKTFGAPVGFSDHTLGLFCSRVAMALGACAIERHFTLSRDLEGPDHILSSEPEEMRALAREAALIRPAIGDGLKRVTGSEYVAVNAQRKALYASRDIAEGEAITQDRIAIKGPGIGIAPRFMEVVVGRRARRAVPLDHPITWDDI